MNDDTPNAARSRFAWQWWAGWLLFIVFVFYPLSVGPAARLFGGSDALMAFYIPLEFLYESCQPVHDFYDWYLGLWGVR